GVLIYHNTFVSPDIALNLQTPIAPHNFFMANNLFVGPATVSGRTVDWTARTPDAAWAGNGYFPDDGYWLGTAASPRVYDTLAEAQAPGIETQGRVLTMPIFASGYAAPATYTGIEMPGDLVLADRSNAI